MRELREGWSFFWATPWLWMVVVGFGVLNVIHAGAWLTLGPAVADDTIGRQGWGFVLSAEAAGLLAHDSRAAARPARATTAAGHARAWPCARRHADPRVSPHLVGLVAAAFLAGAGTEIFGMGWNLAMQENIDDRMLSRAYSYDVLGSFVAIPIGQLAYGPLADAFGFRPVLMASAVAYVAVVALVLCSRSVRTLPRSPRRARQRATRVSP